MNKPTSHPVMVAVVCAPGEEPVVCLDPEFITPQDGQDGELFCSAASIR
jgi:hypothetical protein